VEAFEKVVVETQTLESEKPKSAETLGQSDLISADNRAAASPSQGVVFYNPSPTKKVVDKVLSSLKEVIPDTDVVPDVSTSLAQPEPTA
ncbi:hypothetical protein A2U01_0083318, partial [Trifolium medium]|nr:hypothetical protein [Trifolium medium]